MLKLFVICYVDALLTYWKVAWFVSGRLFENEIQAFPSTIIMDSYSGVVCVSVKEVLLAYQY